MAGAWLERAGPFVVERDEILRPGGQPYLDLDLRPAGCLHTTEGNSVDNAISYNRSKGFGSHFYVGEGRIVQCRPLDAQASSLPAHNDRFIQIEAVAFSQQKPWLPTAGTLNPLAALLSVLPVPRKRPKAWADDGSDITGIWASNNSRRQSRLALTFDGWVGHLEVPDCDPTWHWDPGALRWTDLFALVDQGDDVALDDYIAGQTAYRQKYRDLGADPGDPPAGKSSHFNAGWTSERFGANNPKPTALVTVPAHTHEVKGTAT